MLNRLQIRRKNEEGFGLLELMLSMVVVALLLIMATRYYQSARTSARVNTAISMTQAAITAADNISNAKGSYTGIVAADLTPFLPNNSLTSPWGEAMTVAPSGTGVDSDITFGFQATPNDCTALIGAMENTANAVNCTAGKASLTFNYNHNNN